MRFAISTQYKSGSHSKPAIIVEVSWADRDPVARKIAENISVFAHEQFKLYPYEPPKS